MEWVILFSVCAIIIGVIVLTLMRFRRSQREAVPELSPQEQRDAHYRAIHELAGQVWDSGNHADAIALLESIAPNYPPAEEDLQAIRRSPGTP